MILSVHSITGAVLATNSGSVGAAIVLGLTSHYFLDSIPHVEYKIENITHGDFKSAGKEFVKIFIDLSIGLLTILYLIQNKNSSEILLALTGAFFAILPDGLAFLNYCIKNKERNIFTKALNKHSEIHKKIHSVVTNKIITISSQAIIVAILIFLLLKK